MHRVLLFCFALATITLQNVSAQDVTLSRKAREVYDKAQKAWQERKLPEATELFEKVLEIEPNSYDTHLRLAQVYEL